MDHIPSVEERLPDPWWVKHPVVEIPYFGGVGHHFRSRRFKIRELVYARRQWHIKSITKGGNLAFVMASLPPEDQRLIEELRDKQPEQPWWCDDLQPKVYHAVSGRGGYYHVTYEWRKEVHRIRGWEEVTP